MVLEPYIIRLIEQKSNISLTSSRCCNSLMEEINKETKRGISVTTLKRILGFVEYDHAPMVYTLDTIAIYLGYSSWSNMLTTIAQGNSSWITNKNIVSSNDLKLGDIVIFEYYPDRHLQLVCLGDNIFEVSESCNSKLHDLDKLTISSFVEGYPLIVSKVVRGEFDDLGAFVAAEESGLQHLQIIRVV